VLPVSSLHTRNVTQHLKKTVSLESNQSFRDASNGTERGSYKAAHEVKHKKVKIESRAWSADVQARGEGRAST
jgi:hypothetical protein